MNIGLKIKELADKKNISLSDIAKALGKTKQAVYEMVDKEDVNTQILKVLSSTYDVPIMYFFGESEENIYSINEKLEKLNEENNKLKQEIQSLKGGQGFPAKIMIELEVNSDEFIKMGLKDKIIQVLNK